MYGKQSLSLVAYPWFSPSPFPGGLLGKSVASVVFSFLTGKLRVSGRPPLWMRES